MSYGTEMGVKERCNIDLEDEQYDEQIARAMAYADAIIDNLFADVGYTVPSPTPQIIKDASDDLAAYYILRSKEPEKAKQYRDDALSAVNLYLSSQYDKGGAVAVETTQVDATESD